MQKPFGKQFWILLMKFEIINIKRDQRIEKNNKTASIYMYMLNFYITTTVIEPNILLLIINYQRHAMAEYVKLYDLIFTSSNLP